VSRLQRLLRWTSVGLVLALLLTQLGLPSGVFQRLRWTAEAATTVAFSPANTSISVGEEIWVAVLINDVSDLVGVDMRMAFDPNVIEIVGGALEAGSIPRPDFVQANTADNNTGTIQYVVIQIGGTPSSGSGTMARLRVRGKANGTSSLVFTQHDLASSGAGYIAHSVNAGQVQVGTGSVTATPTRTATATAGPSPTFTQTPLPTHTPTRSSTPTQTNTPLPTFTPFPTNTPTNTPTITETPLPSMTAPPTATPTASPTSAQRSFSGYVYQGGFGDTSRPLAGVEVQLWASWITGHPGTYVAHASTDAQGRFTVSYNGSQPHYSLIEIDDPGFASSGAQPAPGGVVPDSTGNWIEFRNAAPGTYVGSLFFDYSLLGDTATPTLSPTHTPGATSSVSATPSGPTPTPFPYGTPVYTNRRAVRDTYLNQREPEQNYGGYGHIHLGNHAEGPIKTGLVWFDLTGIPPQAVVGQANLLLFGQDVDGIVSLDVTGLRRSWVELEATWRESSAKEPWGQPGALSTMEDRDAASVRGTFTDGGLVQYYTWDVTDLVQAWVSGVRPNYGALILTSPGTKAKETHGLYSSNFGLLLLRPKLEVEFTVPEPTPTPTNTPMPTVTPTSTPTKVPVGRQAWLPMIQKNP
jgi:hypothetical protein